MKMQAVWKLINQKKNADYLMYLYERWQDEKEYEDIKEYSAAVAKFTKLNVVGATKRPFGFKIKCDNGTLHAMVKVKGDYLQLHGKKA